MIPSKREIESEIKRCDFKMDDMPEYIESLLEQHIDDHGEEQYSKGYSAGYSDGIDDSEDDEVSSDLNAVEYAIAALKEVKSGHGIDNKLTELEFERCRLMPVTP